MNNIFLYKVRKSPFDIASQQGAFFLFEVAVKIAKKTKCNIYDNNLKLIWEYDKNVNPN